MTNNPAAIAKFNEGCMAIEAGDLDAAARAYSESLVFDPNFEEALTNFCLVMSQLGQGEELGRQLSQIAQRKLVTTSESNNAKLFETMDALQSGVQTLNGWVYSIYHTLSRMYDSINYNYWRNQIAQDRGHVDPRCLYLYGAKISSQNDEDGVLNEIFRRIGVTNRYLVEFGVSALEANSLNLLQQGWNGLWMDANTEEVARIRAEHQQRISSGKLKLLETFITAENINQLLKGAGVPVDLDYFSIDIDGNDYYILEALEGYHPRVISVEYNGQIDPNSDFVMPYDPHWPGFQGNSYMSCGLKALSELADRKGYSLVGCNFNGVNAFFVRKDLLGDKFYAPGDVSAHHRQLIWNFFSLPLHGHPLKFER